MVNQKDKAAPLRKPTDNCDCVWCKRYREGYRWICIDTDKFYKVKPKGKR